MSEVLESNANVLLSSCSPSEQTDVFIKVVLNSRQRRWIWFFAARKLKKSCQHILEEDEVTEETVIMLHKISDVKLDKIMHTQIDKLFSVPADSWAESFQILTSVRYILEQLKANANEDTMTAVAELVKILQSWQLKYNDCFLFGRDLKVEQQTETSAEAVWAVIEIIRLLSTIVEFYPKSLSHSLWDFILCSMTSWCATLEESWTGGPSNQNTNPIMLSFTVALCHLIQNCSTVIAEVERNKEDLCPSFPPNLVFEWNDVFSDAAYNAVLPLFFQLSRCNTLFHISSSYLMETLALSVCRIPIKHIQTTVEELSPLLLAKHSAIQFAAHELFIKYCKFIS